MPCFKLFSTTNCIILVNQCTKHHTEHDFKQLDSFTYVRLCVCVCGSSTGLKGPGFKSWQGEKY